MSERKSTLIGIIGTGNMGGAIAGAMASDPSWEVHVHDANPGKVQDLLLRHPNLKATESLPELVNMCKIIILAVKPQSLPSLFSDLRMNAAPGTRWISIAAGVSLDVLTEGLGTNEVIRIMPNLTAGIHESVTAVCMTAGVSKEFAETVVRIANTFGTAFVIPEKDMPAFIGISGSAVGYHLQYIHALAMAGTHQGIPYARSLPIVCDTLHSTVALLKASGKNPMELLASVCSAGGTTIEGMKALAENGFDSAIYQAVSAVAEKSSSMELLAGIAAKKGQD
ncbi:pyrroline-5-carboxylate reductase [Parasphaerochaeta coccoides]|uniref:Pyrroline-5-carboxylate reductase n=1 Tax=Parasphaerochaeta coccoides (strain ATCC BAA-1237 / DSM 17374 / SPN1) TaxID=760011 RepID=F4GIK4_PARC1|nr:pyrroline-5-carboxylate reductase [Parasphaerochaeta coccoides]AEC02138.1 pyrroline-5-carboxylate reductase [Parasphaerochaeta coccoides DSM 17374]